jgi:hypothetical protein
MAMPLIGGVLLRLVQSTDARTEGRAVEGSIGPFWRAMGLGCPKRTRANHAADLLRKAPATTSLSASLTSARTMPIG